jgi:hypothetical protein
MSFVQQLLCENDEPIDLPNLEQLTSAISKLDGKTYTMILLKGQSPDTNLSIGGGFEGHYVVSLTYDNRRFFTLLNPSAPAGRLSLICGGQRGEFEATKCADRPSTLQAVKTFATTGERDTVLRWSKT